MPLLDRPKPVVADRQIILGVGVARIGRHQLLTDLQPLLIGRDRLGRVPGLKLYVADAVVRD